MANDEESLHPIPEAKDIEKRLGTICQDLRRYLIQTITIIFEGSGLDSVIEEVHYNPTPEDNISIGFDEKVKRWAVDYLHCHTQTESNKAGSLKIDVISGQVMECKLRQQEWIEEEGEEIDP